MDALKAYLVKHFGLAADADEAAVRKLAGEKLPASLILELTTSAVATKSPIEELAEKLGSVLGVKAAGGDGAQTATGLQDGKTVSAPAPEADAVNRQALELLKSLNLGKVQADSAVQPVDVLAAAAKAAGERSGTVRIPKPSEKFDGTKSRHVYPAKGFAGRKSTHPLAGQDVVLPDGRGAYALSDRERVLSGAFMQHRAASMVGMQHMLGDWQKQLHEECVRECEFVGEVYVPGFGKQYIHTPRKLTEMEVKAVISDSTSGGSNIVPYQFDDELITFPLLYNELFPLVTVDDVDGTNQVIEGTVNNVTISTGPTEDNTTDITLETTTSLIAKLTWNMFNATGAILFGRDFLSDTPTNILQTVMKLYNPALGKWLDEQIAIGDGTTEPEGVTVKSGVGTYSFANSTAGPQTVADWEGMMAAVPLQYRRAAPRGMVWLMRDAMWWRIRGLSVSSTDQRRIFGYNDSKYEFYDSAVKINESVAAGTVSYFDPANYVMKRRKGLEFQTSTEGRTNMLLNELLVVARSRWGGQIIRPLAVAKATNASVHS